MIHPEKTGLSPKPRRAAAENMAIGNPEVVVVKRAGLKVLTVLHSGRLGKSPVFVGAFRVKRKGICSVSESIFWRPAESYIAVASMWT